MDILNVNNKIALNFAIDDFSQMLNSNKVLEKLHLPTAV